MDLYLHPDLKQYFADSPAAAFEQIMALHGEVFRYQDGRKTQRIVLGGQHYFIKQHQGVGWKEVIKNILQCRWPVLGARNEWRAIQHMQKHQVAVPFLLGYGCRGGNPARLQSFVLMEALSGVVSLEDLCATWRLAPPSVVFKRKMLAEVARIARIMHSSGMNHRDFYLCHFLLDVAQGKLYLIDLHRAQIRQQVPERWVIKDLAGLYFSSKEIGLTKRDLYRFMKAYSQQSLRDSWGKQYYFWQKVKIRGERLYHEHAVHMATSS